MQTGMVTFGTGSYNRDQAIRLLWASDLEIYSKAGDFAPRIILFAIRSSLGTNGMSKDKLFLLKPGFEDPAYPDQLFYCWHCALIEGVLASFPALGDRLDIEHVDWQRPRKAVIELAGEDNQNLPLLILKNGDRSPFETGRHEERSLISDPHKILAALAERHGFPLPHP